MLTATVCTVILAATYKWELAPIGAVPDESRKMLYDILIFLVGVISGYVSHGEGGEK